MRMDSRQPHRRYSAFEKPGRPARLQRHIPGGLGESWAREVRSESGHSAGRYSKRRRWTGFHSCHDLRRSKSGLRADPRPDRLATGPPAQGQRAQEVEEPKWSCPTENLPWLIRFWVSEWDAQKIQKNEPKGDSLIPVLAGVRIHLRYVRTIWITPSAASSEDLELRGMWLRMWSSISSAIRLLIAPRAAERRWRTSKQESSLLSARRTLSSWPITFCSSSCNHSRFSLDQAGNTTAVSICGNLVGENLMLRSVSNSVWLRLLNAWLFLFIGTAGLRAQAEPQEHDPAKPHTPRRHRHDP